MRVTHFIIRESAETPSNVWRQAHARGFGAVGSHAGPTCRLGTERRNRLLGDHRAQIDEQPFVDRLERAERIECVADPVSGRVPRVYEVSHRVVHEHPHSGALALQTQTGTDLRDLVGSACARGVQTDVIRERLAYRQPWREKPGAPRGGFRRAIASNGGGRGDRGRRVGRTLRCRARQLRRSERCIEDCREECPRCDGPPEAASHASPIRRRFRSHTRSRSHSRTRSPLRTATAPD